MKHLKEFKLFESNSNIAQIIKDSLVDITDDGFNLDIHVGDRISISIRKPSDVKWRPNSPFNPVDIINSLVELDSQLTSYKIGDIYYHIVGYESSTWYSAKTLDELKELDETFDLMEVVLVKN